MLRDISARSIRAPIPAIVLFAIMVVAGLVAFRALRINFFPDMDVPTVTVTITQPGAAPSELETEVTRKVENAVAGVGSVSHVISTINDGISHTAVEFEYGKDTALAVDDVRDAVTRIRNELPQSIDEPIISRKTWASSVVEYAVDSPRMTLAELSWFVDNDIAKALQALPGVAQVKRSGGVDREVRVNLRPDRLAAFGITAAQVNQQIRAANVNVPGGRANVGGFEQALRATGSVDSFAALAGLSIALPGGRSVRLDEIADVADGHADPRVSSWYDGRPVVGFAVIRSVGSSELHVARKARAAIERLRVEHPEVRINEVFAAADFTAEQYHGAVEALAIGAALAVLVVWLFLRDARSTVISAIAMPISLVPTFAVMQMAGFALSNITLLGLTMVVGILVDDAIVEVENIVRHMQQGKRPFQAALEAADEIGLAVIGTTLALVCVFMPVTFLGGLTGEFFRPFGLTVAASVFFSLMVARLLTPVMGAYLLRPVPERHHDGPLMQRYLRLVDWSLRHRMLVLLGGVAFFGLSLLLVPLLPKGLLPTTDRSVSQLMVELPPGARLADTERAVEAIRRIVTQRPEVRSFYANVGGALVQFGPAGSEAAGEVRRANAVINLVPRGDRAVSFRDLEVLWSEQLKVIPGIRYRFGGTQPGAALAVVLAGEDPAVLERTAAALESDLRTVPLVSNPSATSSLRRPELRVEPDAARAADLGVATADIATTARISTIGEVSANLAKFNLDDRQIPIRVQVAERDRDDLDALRALRVPARGGSGVPLASVADFRLDQGASQIDRYDRRRNVTIGAEINNVPLGTVVDAVAQLPTMRNLPAGVQEVTQGDVEVMKELFAGILLAIGAGILLVYCVLVLLFHDFMQPVTILAALPLSIGGALGMLLVTREPISLTAAIGILMLLGIAAKNSILLVEYAIVAMDSGVDRLQALREACHKRARPIVMTTVAMAAGMLPIALRIGADAEFRAPMAIAVIGGLITSTVLSLLYIPVVFTYIDDVDLRLRRFARRLL